jgi:hypothetical protein
MIRSAGSSQEEEKGTNVNDDVDHHQTSVVSASECSVRFFVKAAWWETRWF